MSPPPCWSCGAARAPSDALCRACGKVQPVPPLRPGEPSVVDKFAVLGVERSFDLDPARLEAQLRALSRKLHPDRFARASPAERRYALEQTTLLNDAYRTLRDPGRRGEHLLELRGIHFAGEAHSGLPIASPVSMSPEFLEQMMEDREKLVEARISGDAGQVAALARGIQAQRDATLATVARMLRCLDAPALSPAAGAAPAEPVCTPAEVAEQLARLRYYARYLDEVEGRAAEG